MSDSTHIPSFVSISERLAKVKECEQTAHHIPRGGGAAGKMTCESWRVYHKLEREVDEGIVHGASMAARTKSEADSSR